MGRPRSELSPTELEARRARRRASRAARKGAPPATRPEPPQGVTAGSARPAPPPAAPARPAAPREPDAPWPSSSFYRAATANGRTRGVASWLLMRRFAREHLGAELLDAEASADAESRFDADPAGAALFWHAPLLSVPGVLPLDAYPVQTRAAVRIALDLPADERWRELLRPEFSPPPEVREWYEWHPTKSYWKPVGHRR